MILLMSNLALTLCVLIASKHSDGIIIANDGRSLSTSVLVDVNDVKNIYRITNRTYIACVSSPSEFESLLNRLKSFVITLKYQRNTILSTSRYTLVLIPLFDEIVSL